MSVTYTIILIRTCELHRDSCWVRNTSKSVYCDLRTRELYRREPSTSGSPSTTATYAHTRVASKDQNWHVHYVLLRPTHIRESHPFLNAVLSNLLELQHTHIRKSHRQICTKSISNMYNSLFNFTCAWIYNLVSGLYPSLFGRAVARNILIMLIFWCEHSMVSMFAICSHR